MKAGIISWRFGTVLEDNLNIRKPGGALRALAGAVGGQRSPPFGRLWLKAISAALLAAASTSYGAEAAPERAAVAGNIVLTAAQREKLHVETIKPSTFRRTIDTTGTVGFDNDQATTVLAPVSGPVSRLMVSLGAKVKAGDVLATVASPDYATAISAYRKAVATAKNARRIADLAEQLSHNNLARKEVEQAQTDAANAEADRDAALEQLHSLGVDAPTIQAIQENRPLPELRRDHSLADRRNGRGEADHARPTLAGRHDAVLHRRRSFPGVGHGEHF